MSTIPDHLRRSVPVLQPPDALDLMLMNLMVNLWDHVDPFVPAMFDEEIQGFVGGLIELIKANTQ